MTLFVQIGDITVHIPALVMEHSETGLLSGMTFLSRLTEYKMDVQRSVITLKLTDEYKYKEPLEFFQNLFLLLKQKDKDFLDVIMEVK